MLLVKTKTGPSPIAGTGLFADEFIPEDTVVWRFSPQIDLAQVVDEDMSLRYAYISKQTGRIILPGDDAKYINHSTTPNVGTRYEEGVEEDINFALRDIKVDEEITIDYATFAKEGTDFLA